MLSNQLRRRAWSTGQNTCCWHCGGSGWCNCAVCGTYSRSLEVVPGPCVVHAARANAAGPEAMLSMMPRRATRKASRDVGGKSSKTAAAHEVFA